MLIRKFLVTILLCVFVLTFITPLLAQRKIPVYDMVRAELWSTTDSGNLLQLPIRGYNVGMTYDMFNLTQWSINNLPTDFGHDIDDLDTEHIQQERAHQLSHYKIILLDIETLGDLLKNKHSEWSAEQLYDEEQRIRLIYYKRFKKYLPHAQIVQYNHPSHLTRCGEKFSDAVQVSIYWDVSKTSREDYIATIRKRLNQIDSAYNMPVYVNIGPRDYSTDQLVPLGDWDWILNELFFSGRFDDVDGLSVWDAPGGGRRSEILPLTPYFESIGNVIRQMNYPQGFPPFRGPYVSGKLSPEGLPGLVDFWTATARTEEVNNRWYWTGLKGNILQSDYAALTSPKLIDAGNKKAFNFWGLGNAGFVCEDIAASRLPTYYFVTAYRTQSAGNGALIGSLGDQNTTGHAIEWRTGNNSSIWNGGPVFQKPNGWVENKWSVTVAKVTDGNLKELWHNLDKTTFYTRSGDRYATGLVVGIRGRLNTPHRGIIGEVTMVVGHLTDEQVEAHIRWLMNEREIE